MFNRHQAEITVMQFTGHSLPVHQSRSVPWEFFSSSHFISQIPPTRFPLITAIRMCHLIPVHHLEMAFLAGSKGQNITDISFCIFSEYFVKIKWYSHTVVLTRLNLWRIKRKEKKYVNAICLVSLLVQLNFFVACLSLFSQDIFNTYTGANASRLVL